MFSLCAATDPDKVFRRLPELVTFLENTNWPQRNEVIEAIQDFQEGCLTLPEFLESSESTEPQALPGFVKDLAIWIVERFYRPSSLAEVKRLQPDFVQAGLGFLLYEVLEQQKDRPDLTERELLPLQYIFEHWINSIWITNGDFIATFEDDGVSTTGQLIAWLRQQIHCDSRITNVTFDECVTPLLEELERRAP